MLKLNFFCEERVTEKGILCKAYREFLINLCRPKVIESINSIVRQSPSCFKKDSNKEMLLKIAKEADEENVVVELDTDGHVKPDFVAMNAR